ncbi:unnamed protein product, partial [Amoebophrya sp. A120]
VSFRDCSYWTLAEVGAGPGPNTTPSRSSPSNSNNKTRTPATPSAPSSKTSSTTGKAFAPPPPRSPSKEKQDKTITSLIKRDVNRTLPNEPFFQTETGQEKLFRVLKAVSRRLWEVGYCQGLNFIVATLLLQFNGDEEIAFQCTIAMLWRLHLVDFYSHEFRKIRPTLWKFDQLVSALLPKIAAVFQENNVTAEYYALSWFLTLFSADLPQDCVRRIWDLYFAYGDRIIFQVGLALLYHEQTTILALADRFELLLKHLKTFLRSSSSSGSRRTAGSLSSSSTSRGRQKSLFSTSIKALVKDRDRQGHHDGRDSSTSKGATEKVEQQVEDGAVSSSSSNSSSSGTSSSSKQNGPAGGGDQVGSVTSPAKTNSSDRHITSTSNRAVTAGHHRYQDGIEIENLLHE